MKKSFWQISLRIILIVSLLLFSAQGALAAVADWQKGLTISPTSPTDFASDSFKQSLSNLAATGANFVTLIIPYYQSSVNAIDLAPGWNTPTDEALIEAINSAHSLGLNVMLKMHPEVVSGEWRGAINPEDREGWFSNYSSIVLHYATLAQQYGVEELCLGAEMFNMTSSASNASNTSFWNSLIGQVKGVYSGLLTYSAQHSYPREAETIEFWNLLDYAGLAAYYPLAADSADPSVEELKSAWATIDSQVLGPLYQQIGKPIMFTEIGYRSMDDTHIDPWDWGRSGAANEAEQAQNYEALFSYWNDVPYMAGVHLWDWSSDPNAGGPGDTNYTPQNKQAEQVMTQWFGGSGEVPTSTPTPTETPEPSPSPSPVEEHTVSVLVSPETPIASEPLEITTQVQVAEALENVLVDVEIYDADNNKILQQYFEEQNLTPEQVSNYLVDWAAPETGEYQVKVGIFSADWQTLYYWNDQALVFQAIEEGEPTPTPTQPEEPTPTAEPTAPPEPTISPAPSPSPEPTTMPEPQPSCQQMHLSWPKKLLDLSGIQTLKAWIGNHARTEYILYWKTEGGEEQVLFDSSQGKYQAGVIDFGNWNWQEKEQFIIDLIAKDLQGNILGCAQLIISILP